MPANNRIYYATQAVILEPCDAEGKNATLKYIPQGLQSVGMTTNFALEQVFQLGQLDLYDNLENVPEVEVTMSKVIDGTPPLYLLCMGGTTGITGAVKKELSEVSTNRVHFNLNIYSDTNTAASGTAVSSVFCSGMYLSSVSYTFPVEGNSTEEITLVGNSKKWQSASTISEFNPHTSANGETTSPSAPSVVRRQYVNASGSSLPTGSGGFPVNSRLNNVTISTNLGREAIFELGRMAPYFRYVNFPVEVTSEFEVIALSGDYVDADDFSNLTGCGSVKSNVFDKSIKILVCGSGSSSMSIDLGGKNKLTSVNYTGGDTGGGNATMTYSFQTFNKLIVDASGTFANTSWVDNTADQELYK
jgi:hypothetical protein